VDRRARAQPGVGFGAIMAATGRRAPAGAARQLADAPAFRIAVRTGFLARGLTYALIGAVAIALALGAGSHAQAPNQQGALSLVASAPLGSLALIVIAIGLGAYAMWKLVLAAIGVGPEGGGGRELSDRVENLAGGLVYAGFCALAVRVLVGSSGNQTREQRQTAAGVLSWPGGRELVGAAGVVLVAVCLHQIYTAVKGEFAQESKTGEMGARERRVFMGMGRTGLIARSLVFAVSGYFLIRTAIDFHVSRGIGLDGALAEVHRQTYGNVLLVLTGIGLLLFAAFSVMEARRRRL
jgi:hypothetical protein